MSFNGQDIVFCIDTYNSSIMSHEYASAFVSDTKKYHAQSIIICDGLSGFPNRNNFAITEIIEECARQNIPYNIEWTRGIMTLIEKHHEEEIKKRVKPYLEKAHAIQFDGCHKIYILESSESMWGDPAKPSVNGEAVILLNDEFTTEMASDALISWFKESCPLVFINYVKNDGDSNEDYERVVEQGDLMFSDLWDEDEYEDEEEF